MSLVYPTRVPGIWILDLALSPRGRESYFSKRSLVSLEESSEDSSNVDVLCVCQALEARLRTSEEVSNPTAEWSCAVFP